MALFNGAMIMSGTIRVTLRDASWVADFAGTSEASEYVSLFGTCILPLPFSARMPVGVVIADVKARHHGCMVDHAPFGWDAV
jgi:hypothetical protein